MDVAHTLAVEHDVQQHDLLTAHGAGSAATDHLELARNELAPGPARIDFGQGDRRRAAIDDDHDRLAIDVGDGEEVAVILALEHGIARLGGYRRGERGWRRGLLAGHGKTDRDAHDGDGEERVFHAADLAYPA